MSNVSFQPDFGDIDRRQTDPFTIGKKQYVLKEADGEATAKYRNAIAATYKLQNNKLAGFNAGVGDVELLMVSLCLFEVYEHEKEMKERPVLRSFVNSLPPRITSPMFDQIKAMTPCLESTPKERTEAEKEQLKNSPEATPLGST